MRSSRQDTEKHREQILEAAARMVRERGLDGMSVPALMAEVGMTHGGFYRHFTSKETLAQLAFERAFETTNQLANRTGVEHPGAPEAAFAKFAQAYLSAEHRDEPGAGCATSALAGDVGRLDPGNPIQQAYTAGIDDMVRQVQTLRDQTYEDALATLSTMVGALLLSRATRGNPISDDILATALASLAPTS
jgi:TetR/AcrR family transcriptional regulator, transcriptional repressor for nem operon